MIPKWVQLDQITTITNNKLGPKLDFQKSTIIVANKAHSRTVINTKRKGCMDSKKCNIHAALLAYHRLMQPRCLACSHPCCYCGLCNVALRRGSCCSHWVFRLLLAKNWNDLGFLIAWNWGDCVHEGGVFWLFVLHDHAITKGGANLKI